MFPIIEVRSRLVYSAKTAGVVARSNAAALAEFRSQW